MCCGEWGHVQCALRTMGQSGGGEGAGQSGGGGGGGNNQQSTSYKILNHCHQTAAHRAQSFLTIYNTAPHPPTITGCQGQGEHAGAWIERKLILNVETSRYFNNLC